MNKRKIQITKATKTINFINTKKDLGKKTQVFFLLFVFVRQLVIDCANGATVFASATINTFVGIDNVDTVIAHSDCANGTGVFTCATSYAFVSNYVCHFLLLRFLLFQLYCYKLSFLD